MPSVDLDEDGDFEAIRNEDGSSILRLFREYGREQWPQFFVGAVASVLQMMMELVPAFMLSVAIDSLFFDMRAFGLPLVPVAWLPTTVEAQFLFAAAVIGSAYALNTGFGWITTTCGTASPSTSSTTSGWTATTRSSAARSGSSTTAKPAR